MITPNIIKNAIRSTEKYSTAQYKVFDLLADIETNGEINASVKFIMERTKLTMPTVYSALRLFQKDNVIIKNYSNTYKFNQEKLKQIIDLHHNKSRS